MKKLIKILQNPRQQFTYQKLPSASLSKKERKLVLAELQGLNISPHSSRPQSHVYNTPSQEAIPQRSKLPEQYSAQVQQFLNLLTDPYSYHDMLHKVVTKVLPELGIPPSDIQTYAKTLLKNIKNLIISYKEQGNLSTNHMTKAQTKSFAIDLLWSEAHDQPQLCVLLSRGQSATNLKLGEGSFHYVSRAFRIYPDGIISPCALRKVNKKKLLSQQYYDGLVANFKAETHSAQAWARSLPMPQTLLFEYSSFTSPDFHSSTLKSITEVAKYDLFDFINKKLRHYHKRALSHKAQIMASLASQLAKAHQNNLIHLDIKPENILFFKDYGWAFTDISSITIDQHGRCPNTAYGTVQYLAPWDIFLSSSITADRAMSRDCFALGTTFFELLRGGTFPSYPFEQSYYINTQLSYGLEKQLRHEFGTNLHPYSREQEKAFQEHVFNGIVNTFESLKAEAPGQTKLHRLYDILTPLFHPEAGHNKALETFSDQIQEWLATHT